MRQFGQLHLYFMKTSGDRFVAEMTSIGNMYQHRFFVTDKISEKINSCCKTEAILAFSHELRIFKDFYSGFYKSPLCFSARKGALFREPCAKKSLGHKAKTRFFVQLFGEVSIDGECDNVRICGRDGIEMAFCAG